MQKSLIENNAVSVIKIKSTLYWTVGTGSYAMNVGLIRLRNLDAFSVTKIAK